MTRNKVLLKNRRYIHDKKNEWNNKKYVEKQEKTILCYSKFKPVIICKV